MSPNQPSGPSRRQFLHRGAALGTGLLASAVSKQGRAEPEAPAAASTRPATMPATSPARKVVVGVMGTGRDSAGAGGRGNQLALTLAGLPGVEIAWICDVDERNVDRTVASVTKKLPAGSRPPQGVRDFRRVLDDRAVDAMVIATPDHWHAPAAILACAAGKHVYVEKPCCHNAAEGRMLVEAARKHDRLVQHGTQRRTWPALREAVGRLRAGEIGRVLSAKCFYFNDRPSIGRGKPAAVPQWLDWSLWQGPAPEREYRDNVVHYNWHWFWHWGTGELGNNGVHMIDLARWGLGVDSPTKVSYGGVKCRHPDDDQQTPDTSVATFEFGDQLITWENRSWSAKSPLDPDYEVLFAGEGGFLAVRGAGYSVYDLKGKETAQNTGDGGEAQHLRNFVDAVRGEGTLNAEIEEGCRSALLCSLGNIAYRTGRSVHPKPDGSGVEADPEAAALWGREYRAGWEPRV